MKCAYQPVGKYLLIERIAGPVHSLDLGRVLAVGPDVLVAIPGHVIACVKVIATIGKDQYMVHSDDIVAVVTEIR